MILGTMVATPGVTIRGIGVLGDMILGTMIHGITILGGMIRGTGLHSGIVMTHGRRSRASLRTATVIMGNAGIHSRAAHRAEGLAAATIVRA